MPYDGISTEDGTCAICKQSFPGGTHVYFDATKSQGNHLAHKKCLDDLRLKRDKQKKRGKNSVSTARLDPPF